MDKRLHEVPAATQTRDLNQAFAQDAAKQEEAVYTPAYHYKDGGSTSVNLEMSLCAACVILRHSQSLVSPLQLWPLTSDHAMIALRTRGHTRDSLRVTATLSPATNYDTRR
jgi:hypothetical protein